MHIFYLSLILYPFCNKASLYLHSLGYHIFTVHILVDNALVLGIFLQLYVTFDIKTSSQLLSFCIFLIYFLCMQHFAVAWLICNFGRISNFCQSASDHLSRLPSYFGLPLRKSWTVIIAFVVTQPKCFCCLNLTTCRT